MKNLFMVLRTFQVELTTFFSADEIQHRAVVVGHFKVTF